MLERLKKATRRIRNVSEVNENLLNVSGFLKKIYKSVHVMKRCFYEEKREAKKAKERNHKNNREPWKMGKFILRGSTFRRRFFSSLFSTHLNRTWNSPFQAPTFRPISNSLHCRTISMNGSDVKDFVYARVEVDVATQGEKWMVRIKVSRFPF